MSDPVKDEKRRDDTLKRLLGTPPKPHDDPKRKPVRPPKAGQRTKDESDGKD